MGVTAFTINTLGPQGDGIHQGSEGRVFIERTAPGDRIRAHIRKDKQGVARGEVLEIIEPSPFRQSPPCPHYDRCGNCTLQHINERFYRHWKTELVRDAFRRQGLQPRQWLDTIFLAGQNRRRATFSALRTGSHIRIGYYRRRSREVTDITTCLVADSDLLCVRDKLRPVLGRILNNGNQVDIFLQHVGGAADMVITGPIGRKGKPEPAVREALEELLNTSTIARIGWRARERDTIETLVAKEPVVATFGTLQVRLPPDAFLQPTLQGEQALVSAVMAALAPQGRIADLFSGCGTFSGPMLERGPVDAYESEPLAVKALFHASRGQALRVLRRDLFRNPLRRDELNRYDAVVFDPPRAGCAEQAMAMTAAKTGTLIGVSCNPATFARDARILCDGGYWLQTLQIVDQFQWSHHVEVVGVFSRRKYGNLTKR